MRYCIQGKDERDYIQYFYCKSNILLVNMTPLYIYNKMCEEEMHYL